MGAGHSELGIDAPHAQHHEGWLTKESETLKTWNPRYCILAGAELKWWDDETQAKDGLPPRGKIALRYCRVSAAADTAHVDALCIEVPDASRTRLFFQPPSPGASLVWLRALRVASREPWDMPSPGAGDTCPVCNLAAFDLFHRQHHCRRCGTLVCMGCSVTTRALPDLDYPQPVRQCAPCAGEEGPLLPPAERAAAAARAAAEREKNQGLWHEQRLQQSKKEAAAGAEARRASIKAEMRARSENARGGGRA